MYLYIKQKFFSWRDKYKIYDENENLYFDVESESMITMPKFHLTDLSGQELFYIRRRFAFFGAQYEVYQGEHLCATISQRVRWFSAHLDVASDYGDFEIEGDFMGMDYMISCNGVCIGTVHKKWMSWSDCYELKISEEKNAAFFSALVIAIDNCLHDGSNG